jgi:hypothetical protein
MPGGASASVSSISTCAYWRFLVDGYAQILRNNPRDAGAISRAARFDAGRGCAKNLAD